MSTIYTVGLMDEHGGFDAMHSFDSADEAMAFAEASSAEWDISEGHEPLPIAWTENPARPKGYAMAGRTRGTLYEGGPCVDVTYLIRAEC